MQQFLAAVQTDESSVYAPSPHNPNVQIAEHTTYFGTNYQAKTSHANPGSYLRFDGLM